MTAKINGLAPTFRITFNERPAPIKNKVSVKPALAIATITGLIF